MRRSGRMERLHAVIGPLSTNVLSLACTAVSSFFPFPGQLDRLSPSADAFTGSAFSALVTSTQSSALKW